MRAATAGRLAGAGLAAQAGHVAQWLSSPALAGYKTVWRSEPKPPENVDMLHLALRLWCCLLGLGLVLPPCAHAYLDPGAGSMLLQILLGGLAGVAVILKLFWHRIKAFFRMGKDDDA